MDFKERVFTVFKQRVKSGQNIESAKAFLDTDFPGATKEEINDFCGIYATRYTRNFALNKDAVDEALSDLN